MTADHRVVLADDKAVRVVPPALAGHVRVASPSGRPELDDGAKCAVAHGSVNHLLMKIIPAKAARAAWPALALPRRAARVASPGRLSAVTSRTSRPAP